MRFLFVSIFMFMFLTFGANAQIDPFANPDAKAKEGIQSFSGTNVLKSKLEEEPILPEIPAFIGDVAIDNIINAEQAFCYTVEKRPDNYEGYTLNGFAVTGFCGILNESLQKRIVTELFRTPKNVLIDEVADCSIQPKAIIRFIRGVDNTDVLISSPCFSFAIFYANKLKAFNATPAERFIRSLITTFENKKVDFVSPSLYKQAMPIGKEPSMPEKVIQEIKDLPRAKGWNNLSF